MQRKCYLCKEAPARKIEATHVRQNATYFNATSEPIFCSVRCAANWALVSVMESEGCPQWCKQHGWHSDYGNGCADCRHENRTTS